MHRLEDFKNFSLAELDLFEPLTILLGRNGAGKTNLIEGVERGNAEVDRVGIVTHCTILDTSWLLELYQVPGDSQPRRHDGVVAQAVVAATEGRVLVTLPVLFEVANHIVHVRNGHQRRNLIMKYQCDVQSSLEDEVPWTVVRTLRDDILLRAGDLIELARRFVDEASIGYSLADISIIDLARRLQQKQQEVRTLAFDKQLEAYAS